MSQLDDLWSDRGNDTERLVFFSDAVFAVALTLLVIDLSAPAVASGANLLGALGALWPNLLALLISFFVISFFWRAHHRIFHLITRYDRFLIGLNFLYLLGIMLQPFTTDLISQLSWIRTISSDDLCHLDRHDRSYPDSYLDLRIKTSSIERYAAGSATSEILYLASAHPIPDISCLSSSDTRYRASLDTLVMALDLTGEGS